MVNVTIDINYNFVQIIVWIILAVMAWFLKNSVNKANDSLNNIYTNLNNIYTNLDTIQSTLNSISTVLRQSIIIDQRRIITSSPDDVAERLDERVAKKVHQISKIKPVEKEET